MLNVQVLGAGLTAGGWDLLLEVLEGSQVAVLKDYGNAMQSQASREAC